MPNIPFIRQNRLTTPLKRVNKPFTSEHITHHPPAVKRYLERRRQQDRRRIQMRVLFDRRQRGISRRKITLTTQDEKAESDNINDAADKGKHINTTA